MSWPEAFASAVGAICLASFFMGKWPWERDNVYNCDCNCKGCGGNGEEDDEG